MKAVYDEIGIGYARHRQPDPRLRARIEAALEGCDTVVNVGAGAGSYEPPERTRLAVELSREMIGQRPKRAAPAVRASASAIPLADAAVDAALAVLTIHHWDDRERGLQECRRVARDRVVIFTWDLDRPHFWLTDYLPEIDDVDRTMRPDWAQLERCLGPVETTTVPIPADCRDGFLGAYWRRPEAYLDAEVRRSISVFEWIPDADRKLDALRRDLDSGRWLERHGALLEQEELDLGYRLVVARRG